MNFAKQYLKQTANILAEIDTHEINAMARALAYVRDNDGRLFLVGVGGSAATASHAVNDFRKIAHIETYTPTDNVAELTARTNDDGWESTFIEWLRVSKLRHNDGLMVLSVGGGHIGTSENIMAALDEANDVCATTMGIVGRDGGYTSKVADYCVTIPPIIPDLITPHTEGISSIVLHLLVSHPALCPL